MVLLYAAIFAYLQSFSRYGFNMWDEGGFANGSWRAYRGELPMIDFNSIGYLPGRYWYGALMYRLFGLDIQSLRIGINLLTPAMVLMVYFISRRIMPEGFAWIAAAMVLSAPAVYYHRTFPILCVFNLFCVIRVMEKPVSPRLLSLALCWLVTLAFNPEIMAMSLLTVFILMTPWFRGAAGLEDKKTSSPWLSKVLLLPVAGLALMILVEAKLGFFRNVLRAVVQKFALVHTPMPELWGQSLEFAEWFRRALHYLPYGICGLALWRLVAGSKRGMVREDRSAAAVWLLGSMTLPLLIFRSGIDIVARILPLFHILICYVLSGPGLSQTPSAAGKSEAAQLLKRAAAGLGLAFAALFVYQMTANNGYYVGSAGALRNETSPLRMDRLNVMTNASEAPIIESVVRQIRKNVGEGESIFVVPFNPIFYFLSDRPNVMPYDWIFPGTLDAEGEAKLVGRLKAKPPAMVVVLDVAIDNIEARRFKNYAPVVYRYFLEDYEVAETIGPAQLLVPRRTPPLADR